MREHACSAAAELSGRRPVAFYLDCIAVAEISGLVMVAALDLAD